MKKMASIMIIVIIVFSWGIYVLVDSIFPKAGSIKQIEIGMLDSVKIYDDLNKEIIIEDIDLQKIIPYINDAKATRRMSVNDYPSVRPYYVVEIQTIDRILRYIIYEENGTAYVEIPYEGVYEMKREVIDILSSEE